MTSAECASAPAFVPSVGAERMGLCRDGQRKSRGWRKPAGGVHGRTGASGRVSGRQDKMDMSPFATHPLPARKPSRCSSGATWGRHAGATYPPRSPPPRRCGGCLFRSHVSQFLLADRRNGSVRATRQLRIRAHGATGQTRGPQRRRGNETSVPRLASRRQGGQFCGRLAQGLKKRINS